MRKKIGPLSVIAALLLVLGLVNFFRVWFSDPAPGTQPWLVDSLLVTHPLAMVALGYIAVRHFPSMLDNKRDPDPMESITMQNPPSARDQEGP